MTEVWKDVINYHGVYQVSNIGNVKSFQRGREKIMKQCIDSNGYPRVDLYVNSKSIARKVHQLVAESFLSHVPCGHQVVVDHIDNNRRNNHVSNLQLITNRENCSKEGRGKSKYAGVDFFKSRNKWRARIRIGVERKNIGLFVNEIDAHYAYQNELKLLNE